MVHFGSLGKTHKTADHSLRLGSPGATQEQSGSTSSNSGSDMEHASANGHARGKTMKEFPRKPVADETAFHSISQN